MGALKRVRVIKNEQDLLKSVLSRIQRIEKAISIKTDESIENEVDMIYIRGVRK